MRVEFSLALQLEWEKMSPEGTAPKKQFHTSNMYLHYMYSFGGGDGKNWLNDMYQLDFCKMVVWDR